MDLFQKKKSKVICLKESLVMKKRKTKLHHSNDEKYILRLRINLFASIIFIIQLILVIFNLSSLSDDIISVIFIELLFAGLIILRFYNASRLHHHTRIKTQLRTNN